ncbi:MAG: alpha/beta hydrolase [Lentisphaerae bacterium]|jgi:acetyl esterase/lipase|nr:alpha/beta hydrolase [Lentisphaerota bacterium]
MKVRKKQNIKIWREEIEIPFQIPEDAENREHLVDETGDGIERVTDVSIPTISFYPASGKGPHPAVLICPGGGYHILAWNHEGTDVAGWLNSNGISAFILKYRCPERRDAAKADAARAMRVIRSRAGEFNVVPSQIGVLGFSAGGHLAAAVCNLGDIKPYEKVDEVDDIEPRPDFAFLIYPGYLYNDGWTTAPDLAISEKSPPVFLFLTQDDEICVDGGIAYFLAMKKMGVPAEMHIYSSGGHGYGMLRKGVSTDLWPSLAIRWFATDVMKSERW